ncbi:MAG: YbaK/EbsC family protein [Azospirillaceae bacterium]
MSAPAPSPERLTGSAARVQAALDAAGVPTRVAHFPEGTRTAAEAAAAIGCHVDQIAKSVVMRTERAAVPILVVACGGSRVDPAKVAALVADRIGDDPVVRADAAFVRQATGYAIGGVAPIAHATPPVTVLDRDLARHGALWAAAGSPNTVFKLTFEELVRLTGGTVGSIA